MKLLHTGDLHLGKRLHGYSLMEEQAHALKSLQALAKAHAADAVLIAGDVYDRTVPSTAAVSLLDEFLTALLEGGLAVFLIAGNHDSPERLQFASRLLKKSGLHIAAVYNGCVEWAVLEDDHGPLHIGMLPYVTPYEARAFFPDQPIHTQEDAVRAALSGGLPCPGERHVLLAHQYVTQGGPLSGEGVGGLDPVDAKLMDGFDYVALGHIHKRYHVLREQVRYAGSPLKYAFDDTLQEKGALLVTLEEKGSAALDFLPITPLRDVRRLRGPIKALLDAAPGDDALIHAVLTDEEETPDAMRRLRAVYPNILHLSFDNSRRSAAPVPQSGAERKSAGALFEEFFELQNGRPMDDESRAILYETLAALAASERGDAT